MNSNKRILNIILWEYTFNLCQSYFETPIHFRILRSLIIRYS